MIWTLCFKLYILVCNFFAAIRVFHIHVMFHCDGIDNEWSKLHMLVHHSQGNWTISARECFIKSTRYLYLGFRIVVMLNLKREGNLLIIFGNSYLVKPISRK